MQSWTSGHAAWSPPGGCRPPLPLCPRIATGPPTRPSSPGGNRSAPPGPVGSNTCSSSVLLDPLSDPPPCDEPAVLSKGRGRTQKGRERGGQRNPGSVPSHARIQLLRDTHALPLGGQKDISVRVPSLAGVSQPGPSHPLGDAP